MTAVLETRDSVNDDVAANGAAASNTMKAKALHTALSDALLFAAPASMRLPFLEAVRLEFGDGQLVAAATDRFVVGVSRVEYAGESFTVVVSAREAKALAKMAKTTTRSRQASRWVEIVAEGRDVLFQFSTGESMTVRALDVELPNWRKLIPRDAHLMGGIVGMGYHPSLVARFTKVRLDEQGPGTSMVLFASVTSSGKPGPTVVHIGENFVGVLMPQRPSGDRWEYRRADWLDQGASEPVGAGAGCAEMPQEPNHDGSPASLEAPGRTVVIRWIEESHHRVAVQVVADFDPDSRDLPNELATLSGDGFEFVERTVVEVIDAEFDPDAEFFDPPGAMDGDTASPTPPNEVQPLLPAELAAVTIPGDVWRSFLSQETTLDDEHPGAVSLSAVVGEIMRMIAAKT